MRTPLVMVFAMMTCVVALRPPVRRGIGRTRTYRLWTEDFEFRITQRPDAARTRASRSVFTIVVRDKEDRQPIVGGQGRIYGTTEDRGAKTWDGFTYGPEVGDVHAHI